MKMRPKNPIFILISILMPWILFNTFIEYSEKNFKFVRYYNHSSNKFEKDEVCFKVNTIVAVGFPMDFDRSTIESFSIGIYGTYSSQEIIFILNDGTAIPLNARPYTKKQISNLLSTLPKKITRGKVLSRILHL